MRNVHLDVSEAAIEAWIQGPPPAADGDVKSFHLTASNGCGRIVEPSTWLALLRECAPLSEPSGSAFVSGYGWTVSGWRGP